MISIAKFRTSSVVGSAGLILPANVNAAFNMLTISENTTWRTQRAAESGTVVSFTATSSDVVDDTESWPGWTTSGNLSPIIAEYGYCAYGTWSRNIVYSPIILTQDLCIRCVIQWKGPESVAGQVIISVGAVGETAPTNYSYIISWVNSTTIRYFHESGTGTNHEVYFNIPAGLSKGDALWLEVRRPFNSSSGNVTLSMYSAINNGSLNQMTLKSIISGFSDNGDNAVTGTAPNDGSDGVLTEMFQNIEGDPRYVWLQLLNTVPSLDESISVLNSLRNS